MISSDTPAKETAQVLPYNKGYVLGMSLIAAMGGLMFGFDLGVITGVIPFIEKQFSLKGLARGWVVAIFEVGCMAGTLITAYLADKLGRKRSLLLVAASFIVTTLGVVLAQKAFDLGYMAFYREWVWEPLLYYLLCILLKLRRQVSVAGWFL